MCNCTTCVAIMQLGEAIVVELDEIQPICTGTVMTCSYLTVKACPDGGNVVMCAWDGHVNSADVKHDMNSATDMHSMSMSVSQQETPQSSQTSKIFTQVACVEYASYEYVCA